MTTSTTGGRSPAFDQQGALGWRDRALDGLNCVLRCVESVLRFRGLGTLQVARALNGALDPVGRDLAQDFDGCRVRYRTAFDDGTRNVPFVLDRLAAGEPVLLLPDRFHLAGDVYEARHHFHDHAFLAVAHDPDEDVLTVLDTDAAPADGFRRQWSLTPQARRMFTWVGTVERTGESDGRDTAEYFAARVGRDTPLLTTGATALSELLDGLTAASLTLVSARALHVLMLGDIQPLLFVYGHALGCEDHAVATPPAVAAVRDAALRASVHAKRLGTGLIAAHEADDPYAAYSRVLDLARPLRASMDQLGEALVAAGGWAGPGDPTALPRLRKRFAHIERTCFPQDQDVAG